MFSYWTYFLFGIQLFHNYRTISIFISYIHLKVVFLIRIYLFQLNFQNFVIEFMISSLLFSLMSVILKFMSSFSFLTLFSVQFSSVQSLSRVQLFATSWIAACQASLSITNSQSSPKLMCIESVMPSSHLILCRPLLLLPSIPPSITVFSNESTLRMRWPKYWSFSLSISPSNEHSGLVSFKIDWLDLLAVQGTLKSLLQHHSSKHQFLSAQLSLWSGSLISLLFETSS